MERVADDLWAMGLTTEATAMALVREDLNARGSDARERADRGREHTGQPWPGVVTHRQHPETAKGAVFVEPRGRDRSRERDLLQGGVGALGTYRGVRAGDGDSRLT